MSDSIAIVGASGPLGRATVRQFAGRGDDVTLVSRSGTEGSERLDIRNSVAAQMMLHSVRPRVVVYLARPEPEAEITDVLSSLRQFASSCAAAGVQRLIFASSAAVYGTQQRSPRAETESLTTVSPYATMKLESEKVLADVAVTSGITVISFRIFNVYGPGFSNSLVNRLVLGDDPAPVVRVSERFVRDYIHSSDIARAFGNAAVTNEVESAIVNLGTGIGTSNSALLDLIPDARYQPDASVSAESFSVADTARARDLFGFEPTVELSSAIRNPAAFQA